MADAQTLPRPYPPYTDDVARAQERAQRRRERSVEPAGLENRVEAIRGVWGRDEDALKSPIATRKQIDTLRQRLQATRILKPRS